MDRFANYFDISVLETRLVAEAFMTQRQFSRPSGRKYGCLVLVKDGLAEYHFEDHSIMAQKGDIIFLAQNSSSYFFDILSEVYHYIYIDFLMTKQDAARLKSQKVYTDKNNLISCLFEKMLNVWIHRKANFLLECKSLLYQIFAEMTYSPEEEKVKIQKTERIKNAMEYLTQHYTDKNITISYAANLSNISEVHFRRLFKEINSVSPIQYLTLLRIEKAKELLKNNRNSLSDIVDAIGYSNVNYFCKIFKRETGVSPSQYRKNSYK